MTNSLFRKGLVSAVAASVVIGAAFAATSVNTPTVKTIFSAGGDYNFTSNDINITETLVAGVPASGTASLTVTIPGSVMISAMNASSAANDINYSKITSSAFLFVDSNKSMSGSEVQPYIGIDINGSQSGRYPLFNLFNPGAGALIIFSSDRNASGFKLLSSAGVDLNTGVSVSSALGGVEGNVTKLSTVTKATDGSLSFTLNLKALGDTSLDSANISGLGLRPAATTGTGDVAISFVGSAGISDGSAKVATLQTNAAKLDANTTFGVTNTISNDLVTTGRFADFNITIPDNLQASTNLGNIAIKLTNAKFAESATMVVKDDASNTYTYRASGFSNLEGNVSEGNYTISDSNTTLTIAKSKGTIKKINISGVILATNSTSGTDVTVNFATSSDSNISDRNFSSLKTYGATATALKIATISNDGVKISSEVNSSNESVYVNKPVVPGRTEQALADVNLSELFTGSFASGKTITLKLPSGYQFSSAPKVGTGGDANNTLSSSIGTDTATITFASTTGDISIGATDRLMDLNVSGLKISVPSTAKDGDLVTLTVGGTLFSSTKIASTSSVNVGVVKTSTAAFSDNNASNPTVSGGSTVTHGNINFKESFAGQLVAGSTIVVKLTDGTFAPTATCPAVNGTSTLATLACVASDSNSTITYTINKASTSAAELNISLPAVKVSSTAGKSVTGAVSGTAGVVGSFTVAKTVDGYTAANTMAQVSKGDIDTLTGYITLTEGIANGLPTAGFIKLLAPAGVSFVNANGKYGVKSTTSTGSVTAYPTTDSDLVITEVNTTFATNDTLKIDMAKFATAAGGALASGTTDEVRFKVKVNVSSAATDGTLAFKLYPVSGDTNTDGVIKNATFNLLYVGTIPTLTKAADATIAAGGTGSVVPTNAQGTVTYTGAANGINVSSAGVVTVDANATAGATATITATDSATGTAVTTVITVGASAYTGSLALTSGWNLVTTPINASIAATALNTAAVASATSGNKLVWVFNPSAGTYASTGAGAYTGNIAAGQGAWVKSASAQSVSVTGTQNATAFDFAAKVAALPTGWSVVGNSGATTTSAISGVKSAWGFDASINNWKNYSATAVSGYTTVVGVPAGTALWIEK